MCEKDNCNGHLEVSEKADCRQEWSDEFYKCDECDTEYVLHTKYNPQSSVIKSQELIMCK